MNRSGSPALLDWLLDSDPSLRWQVLRDLTDASADQIALERRRVATEGWGAEILRQQQDDGTWGGVAWNPGFDSTMHALWLLRVLGLDPESPQARSAVAAVRDRVTWADCGPQEVHDNRFFEGEVEPCINAQVASAGAWFGQNVAAIIERLLGEQMEDGGWNCDQERGSIRGSFHTTIGVLEALLEWESRFGGVGRIDQARKRGESYLLDRQLGRRLTTGEPIRDRRSGESFDRFAFPNWWHYDVLRALDYLRSAGVAPDARMAEGIGMVEARRDAEGWWPLDVRRPGRRLVDFGEEVGKPSRWITLRALRVLRWYDEREAE